MAVPSLQVVNFNLCCCTASTAVRGLHLMVRTETTQKDLPTLRACLLAGTHTMTLLMKLMQVRLWRGGEL